MDPAAIAGETTTAAELESLLAEPNVGSRRPIWEQYDHTILTNTVVGPGRDAAVLRIKGTPMGVVTAIDCNSRYCDIDPYNGARLAVAEAARNVSCAGGRPLGITNCLNMGNPEQEPGSWHLQESVRGIADACRALDIPVVSGNVSLYNESNGIAIQPTPMIGCVGVVEDVEKVQRGTWQEGDGLLLVHGGEPVLGGSEWLASRTGRSEGAIPTLDTAIEARVQSLAREAAVNPAVRGVHDISQGGLAVTIAEDALAAEMGADLTATMIGDLPAITYWFGERASAILIAVDPAGVDDLAGACEQSGLRADRIGTAGGTALVFPDGASVELSRLRSASDSALDVASRSLDIIPA